MRRGVGWRRCPSSRSLVPHPLADDLPTLLPAGGVGTPPGSRLLYVLISEHGLECPSVEVGYHPDCCGTVCCVTQRRDAARLKRFQNALRQLAFTCIFDGRRPYATEGALQIEERYGNSRKPPAWRQFSTMALQRRKDRREGSILCKGWSVSSPVLATCDIHSKNRDKCQEHHEGTTLSYWLQESSTEKGAFELFRTLLLRCFFSEESEVMKRLSLRSGKRSFKERHRRSTCRRHLKNTGNGTDGLRLPR